MVFAKKQRCNLVNAERLKYFKKKRLKLSIQINNRGHDQKHMWSLALKVQRVPTLFRGKGGELGVAGGGEVRVAGGGEVGVAGGGDI